MVEFMGIESSDGEQCECCGTPCPRRRVVVRSECGDYRRLGSTCAALALRPRDAAKAKTEEATFVRQQRAIDKARKYLADGVDFARVANWLGCFVRTDRRGGVLVAIRLVAGQWVETQVN
jgi:hypothetical protein